MTEKTQERIIEMVNKFGKLDNEEQILINGIVVGLTIGKEKQITPIYPAEERIQV